MKLHAVCSPEDVGIKTAGLELAFEAFQSCGLPGGIFTVARRGSLCFVREYGVRDVHSLLPMETDTTFAILSMTKIVTSLATARLVERGVLGVDDPVSLHLPVMAKDRLRVCSVDPTAEGYDAATATVPCTNTMTVRHLLTHTSGLVYGSLFGRPNGDPMAAAHAPQYQGPKTAAGFAAVPLCFQPGTQFRYSDATALLGLVLEAITHKGLAAILREEVLVPLGMHSTSFVLDTVGRQKLATPYLATSNNATSGTTGGSSGKGSKTALRSAIVGCFTERDAGAASMSAETLTPAASVFAHAKSPAAGDQGLYSTPSDWAKLEDALMRRGEGLLQRETFDYFHAAATPDLDLAGGFNTHFSDQGVVAGAGKHGGAVAGGSGGGDHGQGLSTVAPNPMAPSPQPSGVDSGGPQMFHSVRFGGIAHSLLGLVTTSDANALGASRGTFGWEGMCCTKFEIDPVEELVVTWWGAVAPCWRYNVKGMCMPHIYTALLAPNVPHPHASTSPTAWKAKSKL